MFPIGHRATRAFTLHVAAQEVAWPALQQQGA